MCTRYKLNFVVACYLLPVAVAQDAGSIAGLAGGITAALIVVMLVIALGYFCYKRRMRLKETRRRSSLSRNAVTLPPNNEGRSLQPHYVPPPSYSINDPQVPSNNLNSEQPPPYSTHMNIYHTDTSGQPMVARGSIQGRDNHAFMNTSISSFSDFPSMADILLTSSRTSIPAAVMLENKGKKLNKFSDSAQGDSIDSKVVSQNQQYVYDNPHFSMAFEEVRHIPRDVLNECIESVTDSESETTEVNTGGNWLDPIKNQLKARDPSLQIESHSKTNQSHNRSHASKTSKKVATAKNKHQSKPPQARQAPPLDQNVSSTQHLYKKNQKKKVESIDSGAEVSHETSSNQRGSVSGEDRRCGTGENRLSAISSDSGLGEASMSTKSKSNSKLRWEAATPQQPNKSLTTMV